MALLSLVVAVVWWSLASGTSPFLRGVATVEDGFGAVGGPTVIRDVVDDAVAAPPLEAAGDAARMSTAACSKCSDRVTSRVGARDEGTVIAVLRGVVLFGEGVVTAEMVVIADGMAAGPACGGGMGTGASGTRAFCRIEEERERCGSADDAVAVTAAVRGGIEE